MKISYPLIGDYEVAIKYLLKNIFGEDSIISPPKITEKTKELGSKNSPNFVCNPFKFTLGTMSEALDEGANILIQFGGGCRYGYYHELQRKILEDLGYKFKLINLISGGKMINIFKLLKKCNINKFKFLYYYFVTTKIIKYMDNIDDYIRVNSCYEKTKGSFKKLRKEMLKDFSSTKGLFDIVKKYMHYKKLFKNIPKDNKDVIKIGIIGELYTLMEPMANYNIEEELINMGCSIKRFTNVSYLLFRKKRAVKRYLKNIFIKYRMGADALDNIYNTKYLCEHNYDGIIHIKSSFCTPEISAMPIINKVASKYNVPVIFFSMDLNNSTTGLKTRLEAFYDMLEMRKNK